MKDINFNDLIEALKSVENAEVKQSVYHKDGVFREAVVCIESYTIKMEYIDFGSRHVPLKFYAVKEGESPIHFDSVKSLLETLGIDLHLGAYSEVK